MKISFQTMIRSSLAAALAMGVISAQAADDYPSRPVTIVTPTAAGGGTDIVARLTADKLGSLLGQPMVVNNKPGAGGAVGNQFMIREKNDGYSLFITANSNQLILPWVVKDAGFDPIKDFEPVAGLGSVPYVLAVHPDFEAQSLSEFLKLLTEKPGELYYVGPEKQITY